MSHYTTTAQSEMNDDDNSSLFLILKMICSFCLLLVSGRRKTTLLHAGQRVEKSLAQKGIHSHADDRSNQLCHRLSIIFQLVEFNLIPVGPERESQL
jgi:hypothetical protein